MQIQQLDASYAEAFRAIRLQALKDSPTAFLSSYKEEKERPLSAFADLLNASPSRTIFAALESSEIVAIVGLGRESRLHIRHKASINSMFVKPSYRNQGLGKQLLSHTLRFADSQKGLIQITLGVTTSNLAAIWLYESLGFKPFGIELKASLIDGVYYDQMHMIRLQEGTS